MQKLYLAAIGAAALFAGPAVAQTNSATNTQTNAGRMASSQSSTTTPGTMSSGGLSSGSTTSGSMNSANGNSTSSANTPEMRQKLTQDFEQQGFKNVHVIADSFLVHAVNKQGQPVVMIINPDSVFSMTEVGANNGMGTGTGTNGSHNNTASK